MDLGAIVLVGGQSRRYGQPKHRLNLGNGPHWLYCHQLLGGFTPHVFVSCRPDQLAEFGRLPCITDAFGEIGPIGALASAMLAYPEMKRWLVLAADLANANKDLIDSLLNSEPAEVICASGTGGHQPLAALWNAVTLPKLQLAISQRNYSVMKTMGSLRINAVPVPESWLRNVNEPGD